MITNDVNMRKIVVKGIEMGSNIEDSSTSDKSMVNSSTSDEP